MYAYGDYAVSGPSAFQVEFRWQVREFTRSFVEQALPLPLPILAMGRNQTFPDGLTLRR